MAIRVKIYGVFEYTQLLLKSWVGESCHRIRMTEPDYIFPPAGEKHPSGSHMGITLIGPPETGKTRIARALEDIIFEKRGNAISVYHHEDDGCNAHYLQERIRLGIPHIVIVTTQSEKDPVYKNEVTKRERSAWEKSKR